jgi:hypothetical protein
MARHAPKTLIIGRVYIIYWVPAVIIQLFVEMKVITWIQDTMFFSTTERAKLLHLWSRTK